MTNDKKRHILTISTMKAQRGQDPFRNCDDDITACDIHEACANGTKGIDWDYWGNFQNWSASVATSLMFGVDPDREVGNNLNYDLSKFELARKKVLALCSDQSIEKQSPAEWLNWAQKFDAWRHHPIYKDKFTQIISQLPEPRPETDDSLGDLALSRGQQQELAIRKALIKLKIDADNLPPSEAGTGKSGLRSKVAGVIDMQYFQSTESFKKAWGKFRSPRQ